MKETMKEKIIRLENEVSKLKKELEESYKREQQLLRENISLSDDKEEQFKKTPLYKQMERDLTNLKAENGLNKSYIKTLEEIRGKQAERILSLEEGIKIKNDTDDVEFKERDNILLQIENPDTEELKKIEKFNEIFAKSGVYMEIKKFQYTYIKINFDICKNKRGAGRKKKDIKGFYTLEEIENMIKEQGADKTAKILGISRATFFRKLKKRREWGEPNERFL